jgi:hypothetical protein
VKIRPCTTPGETLAQTHTLNFCITANALAAAKDAQAALGA